MDGKAPAAAQLRRFARFAALHGGNAGADDHQTAGLVTECGMERGFRIADDDVMVEIVKGLGELIDCTGGFKPGKPGRENGLMWRQVGG